MDKTPYENLWIPPFPSDGGSALVVLEYYHKDNDKKRENNTNPYLEAHHILKDELLNVLQKSMMIFMLN